MWLWFFADFLIFSPQSHFDDALLLLISYGLIKVMYTLKDSLVLEYLPLSAWYCLVCGSCALVGFKGLTHLHSMCLGWGFIRISWSYDWSMGCMVLKCETDLKLGLYNVYYLSSIVCVCTSLLYWILGTEDSFDFLMHWIYSSSDLVWASL